MKASGEDTEKFDIINRLQQRLPSTNDPKAHNLHPFLNRKILFVESQSLRVINAKKQESFRNKYQVINSRHSKNGQAAEMRNEPINMDRTLLKKTNEHHDPFFDAEIPQPSFVIFDDSKLSMKWDLIRPIGPGLANLGNTCFLNSVLQCLTYTPPLASYLLSKEHSSTCRSKTLCMLCVFQDHVISCIGRNAQTKVVFPKRIVGSLKSIAKHMRPGRQEDAHEFIRYFIDALVKPCLLGYERADPISKQTTPLHQMFGGYLRSQVECQSCKGTSNTFDPLLDLSLEIRHCNSLQRALSHFTKSELLVKDNQYKCEKCKRKSNAMKRITIAKPPPVLTIQLKRFDFTFSTKGDKLNKPVEYPEFLDILPYTSFVSSSSGGRRVKSIIYDLYAVLVHAGSTCVSGHYYCYVKNSNGMWYCMNDSDVRQVSSSQALQQKGAYMLFYTQRRKMASAENVELSQPMKLSSGFVPSKLLDRAPSRLLGPTAGDHVKATQANLSKDRSTGTCELSPPPSDSEKPNSSELVDEIESVFHVTPPSSPEVSRKSEKPRRNTGKEPAAITVVTSNNIMKGWTVKESTSASATNSVKIEHHNEIYDDNVETWEEYRDQKADLLRYNVIEEHKANIKRKRPTKEDMDYDRGRVKKVRRNKLNNWIVSSR